MPTNYLNLQLFSEEGMAVDVGFATSEAENPVGDGVATETEGDQVALETADEVESFDSLIKGKYKKEYDAAIKSAIDKRFRNQRNLQGQIDAINPMIQALAQKHGVQANPDGSINIEALNAKIFNDDSLYEQEAFNRGMSVEDLKQLKTLERENQMLKLNNQRNAEQQEWERLNAEGEALKQIYPTFDMNVEMENPQFGRLLATLQRSGFPGAVQTAYESVHREEIMGGAMRYAVQRTAQKLSNNIQSGMSRPIENGMSQTSPGTPTGLDPSKLTKEEIADISMRAKRGERITF